MIMNIYQQYGYENRKDYLKSLAEEYNIPCGEVFNLADMLGESEDFDGLVSALEEVEHVYQYLNNEL